jgi:hypothetical protein
MVLWVASQGVFQAGMIYNEKVDPGSCIGMVKPVDGPLLVGDTTLILPTSILAPTELARLLLLHAADLSHDIENIRILQVSISGEVGCISLAENGEIIVTIFRTNSL